MPLIQRPPLVNEVIAYTETVVYATVNVAGSIVDGDEYFIGRVLTTSDGGKTFDAMTEDIWEAGAYAADAVVYHQGHTFASLIDANDVEPGTDAAKWKDNGVWNANGILIENISVTGSCAVLVEGLAMESYLRGYDADMRQALFNNKIILQ